MKFNGHYRLFKRLLAACSLRRPALPVLGFFVSGAYKVLTKTSETKKANRNGWPKSLICNGGPAVSPVMTVTIEPPDKYGVMSGDHRWKIFIVGSIDRKSPAQILSAAVSSYIREMGVDPLLFDLMVSAGKDEIYVVSPVEMMRLGVVNNGRQRAEWTIEAVEGAQYLKGAQGSEYGIAKALFTCVSGGLMLHSIYEAGAEKSKRIANGGWHHSLMINGKTQPVILTKIKVVNGLLNTLFPISRRDAAAISQADSVGHAMQIAPDAPAFVGYRIDIDSRYRERITNFLGAGVPAVK